MRASRPVAGRAELERRCMLRTDMGTRPLLLRCRPGGPADRLFIIAWHRKKPPLCAACALSLAAKKPRHVGNARCGRGRLKLICKPQDPQMMGFEAVVASAQAKQNSGGEPAMADNKSTADWDDISWYSGKTTRRRLIGYGAAAGALGATMLVPAPWRPAFGQAKPYKIGTLQPLSGSAAAGGKTALVGTQMAVDRINKSGGINGRPIELVVADYESK